MCWDFVRKDTDMPPVVVVLLSLVGGVLSVFLLLFLLYVFFLVRPRAKMPADASLLCDYAHRGLHGNGVPENSLRAFELACEAGYGIELDVRLSRDGEVMVFHDYTLARMTGDERRLSELSAANLGELHLDSTEQTIPSLCQVLRLVDGRVPLLVELKGEDSNTALCSKVAAYLRDYRGPYCIESFNPFLLRSIKKHLPDAYCGLLYTNLIRERKRVSLRHLIGTAMMLNFFCTEKVVVEFYDTDGNLVKVKEAIDMGDKKTNVPFAIYESIDGISFVKLVGEGKICSLSVTDFDAEYN